MSIYLLISFTTERQRSHKVVLTSVKTKDNQPVIPSVRVPVIKQRVSADNAIPMLIRQLFDLDLSSLLELSEQAATEALALNPVTTMASPLIITRSCSTFPPCRHCKWRYFIAARNESATEERTYKELVDQAHSLADKGIQRAFFGTGWLGYQLPERILETIEKVCTEEPRLEYYGLFGALDRQSHFDLASAGLSGMLTSLESPNEQVYRSFRPGGDSLHDRLASLTYIKEAGMKVWTGFLVGFGEDADDVAWGLDILRQIEPDSVSLLPFVPFEYTEMKQHRPTDVEWLVKVNAAARIVLTPSTILFSDHYLDVDEHYAAALGFNGSYAVGPFLHRTE